jgi:hypothetical protein
MKQIEREMKGVDEAATDDGVSPPCFIVIEARPNSLQDHVIAPTRVDFPTVVQDDRLGSKFASRSRAYVETERLLDEEIVRKRFDQERKAFVANDEDADDSLEDMPGRFATFAGPDRTEAIAHWKLMRLVDAAADVESTLPTKVISNEQADALFLLASLSADVPRGAPPQDKQHHHGTVASPKEQLRQLSPVEEFATSSTAAATAPEPESVLVDSSYEHYPHKHNTPRIEMNGLHPLKEPVPPKNETPARSTHRIMDMLNDDAEVPVSKLREPRPFAREPTPAVTTPRRLSVNHGATLSRSSLPGGLDMIVHRQEPPPRRSSSSIHAASLGPSSDAPLASPSISRYGTEWTPRMPGYSTGMSEESLRRRDPLNAVRAMLDAKALAEGRIPASMRPNNTDGLRKHTADRERAQMVALPLSRPFSPPRGHDKQDAASKDARRPSFGGYTPSPSAPPLSYNQSPTTTAAHPLPHSSQDAASSQWGHARSHSGSQAQQTYMNSPPQPFQPEPNRPGTNPPPHQSPYSTTSAPQPPSFSSSLPAKPPGPPPSGPINFRFAHYDPAPPRPAYPSPSNPTYPPTSYPPHYGPPPPPPPPHYGGPTSYSGPPAYHSGYVAPPGSFQAPPPPTSAMTPYPPLKIHQYGGQPILPANMAPPPPQSQPSNHYMPQLSPSAGYSPPQQHSIPSHNPSYDQGSNVPRDAPGERSLEPQNRQRRQYRSYHAPGTQFRSYQGPDPGRRRGG